jgi:Zinc knuckle
VVFLCCCRRPVAVACPVCRRMYLLPPFLPSFSCRRLWCGADGDRGFLFFFFTNCYTSTGHNQNCYRKSMSRVHRNPSCSCQKHQLDTRLQTAQRRAHPLGKKNRPFCSDQMTPLRESLTRAFLSCMPPLLAITVSPLSFVALSASGLLIVCRVRDDGTGGMEGHVSRDCTMEQKAKSCYRCGREGHIVRCILRPRFQDFFLVTSLRCSLLVLFGDLSRAIAPNLRAAPVDLEDQVAVLARNAIAAARSVILRVRALRRPEAVQEEEATAVVGEAIVVSGAGAGAAVGAVKKHGMVSHVSCRFARGVLILFVFGGGFFEVTLAVE